MIPTYVIHYAPLTERRDYLEPLLQGAHWVTDVTNQENLTDELSQEWYLPDADIWKKRCAGYYEETPPFRVQKPGDICCSIGHMTAWENFINSDEPYGLFLEDDIVLCNDFQNLLASILQHSPPQMNVLFIGGGFDHTIAPTTAIRGNYHLKGSPSSNCACSYILTKNSATQLLDNMKPFTVSIDFEMNYWFDKLNLNVFHHVPYIALEGTAIGKYQSTQTR